MPHEHQRGRQPHRQAEVPDPRRQEGDHQGPRAHEQRLGPGAGVGRRRRGQRRGGRGGSCYGHRTHGDRRASEARDDNEHQESVLSQMPPGRASHLDQWRSFCRAATKSGRRGLRRGGRQRAAQGLGAPEAQRQSRVRARDLHLLRPQGGPRRDGVHGVPAREGAHGAPGGLEVRGRQGLQARRVLLPSRPQTSAPRRRRRGGQGGGKPNRRVLAGAARGQG
mmetsp:Transcript_66827/g.204621  ORF Transcript_66827/g.204621 Transcript_66827/m.204621 type:complete len:222 (+) Transcript_66827:1435-2100(+)